MNEWPTSDLRVVRGEGGFVVDVERRVLLSDGDTYRSCEGPKHPDDRLIVHDMAGSTYVRTKPIWVSLPTA